MKKLLSALIATSLLLGTIPTVSANSDFNCGEWDDVPSSRMDILTEICEYGLMQGYSESNYGYGRSIVRPELAHIANRIALGTAYYESELEELDWRDAHEQLASHYTDLPNPYENDDFEWLVEAMYFGRYVGLMTGDGNEDPTTYRPFDDINIVETFKVLYEAAAEGDVFSDELENSYMSYDGDPWWERLMYKMEDEGVLLHLDTDYQSFWIGSPLTVSYSDFSKGINREDAAIFLYFMIHRGVIDGEKLQEQLDSPCTTDGGCRTM